MTSVLIVDDSKSVHAYMKTCLDAAKFKITQAFNGQEALTKILAGEKYDLILLDWEMPVMTGPETMKNIKPHLDGTPVIMVTTKNAPDDIKTMLTAGVSDYIMKPFTKDILLEKIGEITGNMAA